MLIAYNSLTGNVRRFVNKLEMDMIEVNPTLEIKEKFVLVTFTVGFGKVSNKVIDFLNYKDNYKNMIGVSSSGNRNWGDNFAKASDIISQLYDVPIVSKFELAGIQKDVDYFKKRIDEL
jgi:protein involved in ribonucleotide reduction